MPLEDAYDAIYPSVVALGSTRVLPGQGEIPHIPRIMGTGFVVDSRGIVMTAGHVARALRDEQPNPHTNVRSPIIGFPCRPRRGPEYTVCSMIWVRLEAVALIEEFNAGDVFFGESVPDVGFVQVEATDLPDVAHFKLEDGAIRIGRSIAFAGFPFGSNALTLNFDQGPTRIVQVTPPLRHGVVSGVHPFPAERPHGFTIDAMSHGGASGSPIFSPEGPEVLGMLYAAVEGEYRYTYALSSWVLNGALQTALNAGFQFDGLPSFEHVSAHPNVPPLFLDV